MSSAAAAAPARLAATGVPLLAVRGLERAGLVCAELQVAAGECVAVTGPSGSGKTLLLRAIADLDPNQGEVRLSGQVRERYPAPAWRRQVMLVPAEPGWWAVQVLAHFRTPPDTAMLGRLGFRDEVLDWAIDRLSTGERQRLALARALAESPRVLLLDEPTSALDLYHSLHIMAVLKRLTREQNMVTLVAIHDLNLAARCADDVLAVKAGKLQAFGPLHQCLRAELIQRLYGVEADILPGPDDSLLIYPRLAS